MPASDSWTSETLAAACAADGEFRIAGRFWIGGLRLEIGGEVAAITVADGRPRAGDPGRGGAGVVTLTADPVVWAKLLAARPPRFYNDIFNLTGDGQVLVDAEPVLFAQYYPAVMRALELLRPADPGASVPPKTRHRTGAFDSPVGRYVHLELEGQDHRVYFEEAGSGIPLLLQHTAGCHGSQFRHLFECREITDHFRLIAYDLPFHGKSLPPVGPKWWASEYQLKAGFLRSVHEGSQVVYENLAVMPRVTLGHTGRELMGNRPTVAVFLLINAAAITRIFASWHTEFITILLLISGVCWIAAFGLFEIVYGPMLLARRHAS